MALTKTALVRDKSHRIYDRNSKTGSIKSLLSVHAGSNNTDCQMKRGPTQTNCLMFKGSTHNNFLMFKGSTHTN